MTSSISHEFMTPIRSMNEFASEIKNEAQCVEIQRKATLINNTGQILQS